MDQSEGTGPNNTFLSWLSLQNAHSARHAIPEGTFDGGEGCPALGLAREGNAP